MDASSIVAAFTPSKILIQTSVLPLISVDPAKKTWLGDFLDPKVYAVIGESIFKLDPAAGKVSVASQADLDAIPNNWGNLITLVVALAFVVAVLIKFKHR